MQSSSLDRAAMTDHKGRETTGAARHRRFSSSQCMLGAVERVLDSCSDPVDIVAPSTERVWIDPVRRQYSARPNLPESFFSQPASSVEIVSSSEQGFAGIRRPVDELLYRAAYHGASGKLWEHCQPYDVLELRVWPNFTRLPCTRHMISLCSLLSRRPTSLSFAYRMLRMPEPDAFRFCSAISAAGYVRIVSSQPSVGSSSFAIGSDTGAARGSFWSRLFERISGL